MYDNSSESQVFEKFSLYISERNPRKSHYSFTNVISFQVGAPVAYYNNCGEVREGSFLCHQKQHSEMTPLDIISEILSSDEEIRSFCKENNIGSTDDHIFR